MIEFIVSLLIGISVFVYGINLFSKYSFVEVYKTVKITPQLVMKEYLFYILYGIGAVIGGFFIETTSSLIFYIIITLLGLFISLFEYSDGLNIVELGTVEKKEGGEWKFDKNKIFVFLGYVIVIGLSYIIYTQPQYIEARFLGLAGPAIYPIIYFISFTDGKHKYILERFLYLLMAVGVAITAYFFNGIVDNYILGFTLIGVFMIVLGLVEKVAGHPILGYMDLPVAVALMLSLYGYTIILICIILVFTFVQGIMNSIKKRVISDKSHTVGFYLSATPALVLTYIMIFLIY